MDNFISITCPCCNAKLQVEKGVTQAFCPYCGGKLLITNTMNKDNENKTIDNSKSNNTIDNNKVSEENNVEEKALSNVNQSSRKRRPIYQQWWFWLIMGIFTIYILGKLLGTGSSSSMDTSTQKNQSTISTSINSTNTEAQIDISTTTIETSQILTYDYTTNNSNTVNNGNSGVYSYCCWKSNEYYYYIINFDEGYVYYFGSKNDKCYKTKIDKGDLTTDLILIYQHYDYLDDTMTRSLHFRSRSDSNYLIEKNEYNNECKYDTVSLERAQSILATKTIVDWSPRPVVPRNYASTPITIGNLEYGIDGAVGKTMIGDVYLNTTTNYMYCIVYFYAANKGKTEKTIYASDFSYYIGENKYSVDTKATIYMDYDKDLKKLGIPLSSYEKIGPGMKKCFTVVFEIPDYPDLYSDAFGIKNGLKIEKIYFLEPF